MLKKILAATSLFIVTTHSAYAAKFFEWNDPIQGNYPPECHTWSPYSINTIIIGDGYYIQYNEYHVECPDHEATVVSRYQYWQGDYYSCELWDDNANYTMSWNNCNNWRLYD